MLAQVDVGFQSLVAYTGETWKVKADAYALYFPEYFQTEHWDLVLAELNIYWQAIDGGGKRLYFESVSQAP